MQQVVFALAVASMVLLSSPCTGQTFSPSGQNAFSLPISNITRENRRAHVIGNSFFNKNWVASPASASARDGLGPLFLARSCSACHLRDGRGVPPTDQQDSPALLFRLSIPGKGPQGETVPDPVYGGQLASLAIPGEEPEGTMTIRYTEVPGEFVDGSIYSLRIPTYRFAPSGKFGPPDPALLIGPRIASAVFGLGLLEAVPEDLILSHADPDDDDHDGISGRANRVWNPESKRREVGRFGWKANQADIRQQTAAAFLGDIGITSSIHPQEDLTEAQRQFLAGLHFDPEPELDDKTLGRVVRYLQTLAPPARRRVSDPEVLRGEQLFRAANCTACHLPELQTAADVPGLPELAGQTIQPYTDLLLHDMGPGLADNRPDFEASGSEWRTPPLWGIGLTEVVNGHTNFLHDGRARNLEEAILWHGGEAQSSRDYFAALNAEERIALFSFVNSL